MFLADNHAESFVWISRQFDPATPHQLVLVDAHSDASAAERSDEIRDQMPRVASLEDRAVLTRQWRAGGRLQAYNWIEPLMPLPVRNTCWLAAIGLSPAQSRALDREAVDSLDGRLEVEPRSAGSFADRWKTMDLTTFEEWRPADLPVLLSIDLDFFAGMPPEQRRDSFERIWSKAMDWPNLAGVTFAVSRPWLTDDVEAHALVMLATDAVLRTRHARLEVDATIDDAPDDSLKAREAPGPVPRWDAQASPPALIARWVSLGDRLSITDSQRDWASIRDQWADSTPDLHIQADGGEIDCDGVWRFPIDKPPVLRVHPPGNASGRVRWQVLEAARTCYDLLPSTGLGKGFSRQPGRWIYEKSRTLAITRDFMLAPESWMPGGHGRVRIAAEVETIHGWIPAAPIDIRLHLQSGFRASLSECFGMPYVFGVAGVVCGSMTGVDTAWGADCSNLLIHAWRRNGIPLSWGDPKQVVSQLRPLARNIRATDTPPIRGGDVERGIAIDFGNHMAAVWEDVEPQGILTNKDLVIHHLGAHPEIIELGELCRSRPVFSLFTPHLDPDPCLVKVAGDVVLAGNDRVVVGGFDRDGAHLFLANLEGVPSAARPERRPQYDFRFPSGRLEWLRNQGVDAVSLANNHAGDAGRGGLLEAIQQINKHGIQVLGAGANADEANQPWRVRKHGVDLAVFGISIVDCPAATESLPGVAKLPEHQDIILHQLRASQERGERCIVLLHGGDEYRSEANDDQRHWAAWLANHGADIIAGSHPHVIQRTEHHAGATIVHSLGNAVYPKILKGADSGEVRVFPVSARRKAAE